MPKSPIDRNIRAFTVEWDKLSKQIIPKIKKRIRRGQSSHQATLQIMEELNITRKVEDIILNIAATSIKKAGITIQVDPEPFRKWFLNIHWPGDKFTLSQRIAKKEYQKIIANTISIQLKQNKTLATIAKSMTDKQLIEADISGTIQELDRQARRVAAGDRTAFRTYKTALNKAKRQVSILAQRDAPIQRLKKAYSSVIKASEKLNIKSLDKSVDRAVKAKARYNAERIARTEGAKAYGLAAQERADEDEDVKALRWLLNSAHVITDICDFHANANLHGLGQGVYPKDSFPEFPAHPHCLCIIEEVFVLNKKTKQSPEGFLRSQKSDDQRKMLGVEGRRRFLRNPKTWKRELRNYAGTPKPPSIPKNIKK